MTEQFSLIIIGGGIAGLAVGCYARMNGYKTILIEQNERTGGLCVNWHRGRYSVNGSMQWLVGTANGNYFHEFWRELGVLERATFYNHDQYMVIENIEDGKDFILYTNVDQLEEYLLALAPEDKEHILDLTRTIRVFSEHPLPGEKPVALMGMWDMLTFFFEEFPLIREMFRWREVTIEQFAERFTNPINRKGLQYFTEKEMSVVALFLNLAWLNQENAGYLLGGSDAFSKKMDDRYRELGGTVLLESKVEQILVEANHATGVRLINGQIIKGDRVISCADGYTTLFQMLDGKYITEEIKTYFEEAPRFPPILYANFGIAYPFADLQPTVVGHFFKASQPFQVGGMTYDIIPFHPINYDPYLAPKGSTLVTCMMNTDYDYWEALSQNSEAYQQEKERVLDALQANIEDRFPEVKGKIEMRDLATPHTYYRYTGNWKGSYEGWLLTPKSMLKNLPTKLKGLDGFFMAGQWVHTGGGLPGVVLSARQLVQLLCHEDDKKFESFCK